MAKFLTPAWQAETVRLLLQFLPDGQGLGGEDHGWCWDELSEESQDAVASARVAGEKMLEALDFALRGCTE